MRNLWLRAVGLFMQFKRRFFPLPPLLTETEHKELLIKSRYLEDQTEKVTKLLKCKPDEMLTRINKIQANITAMQNTLRTAHVSTLIEKTHKNCSKHEGPTCKKCEKCLDNECEKCQAVDWLRADLGMEPLLNKDKCSGGGLTR